MRPPAPRRLTTSLAVAVLALAGCSFEGSVDDGGGPPSVTSTPTRSSSATPSSSASASEAPTATATHGSGTQPVPEPAETAPDPSQAQSGDDDGAADPPASSPSSPAPDGTDPEPGGDDGSPGDGLQEIRFAAGQTSTTVSGEAASGRADRYVFEATAGQRADITVTSAGDQVGFSLVGPDGTPLKTTMGEATSGTFELSSDGDYVVGVASGQDGASFTMTLSVR